MMKKDQGRYQNFAVAIYTRVYEVLQMADLNWLRERFDGLSQSIKVDKVYLETQFLYDNHTLVVESFLDESTPADLIVKGWVSAICDALTGEMPGSIPVLDWRGQDSGKRSYKVNLPAHSYRVFTWEA